MNNELPQYDNRLDIYKKHLSDAKRINVCKKWEEVGKKVFSEDIEEILKYKIMVILSEFRFVGMKESSYIFQAPKIYAMYIKHYETCFEQLKNIRLITVVNT